MILEHTNIDNIFQWMEDGPVNLDLTANEFVSLSLGPFKLPSEDLADKSNH